MRRRPRNELLLVTCILLGGTVAFAQYNPPATPPPYNPIALAEITGAPRAAVQGGRITIKSCRRIHTSEGSLREDSA